MVMFEMGDGFFNASDTAITKFKILEATVKLAENAELSKISVREICELAKFSRQTFYEYFKSKYDVAMWCWGGFAHRYLREEGRSLSIYEAAVLMIKESRKYKNLIYNMPFSDEYELLQSRGARRHMHYMRRTIIEHYGLELTEELDFQIRFFVDEESRTIHSLERSSNPMPAEELSRLIVTCVPPKLYELFEAPFKGRAD